VCPEVSMGSTHMVEHDTSVVVKHIAYVLRRFPALSETFITNEINGLRAHGTAITIFSLLPARDLVLSNASKILLPHVIYVPFLFSVRLIVFHLYFLIFGFHRYVTALFRVVGKHRGSFKELLKSLVLFPKTVCIACLCRRLEIEHVHVHFSGLQTTCAEVIADLTGIPFSVAVHTILDIDYPKILGYAEMARFVVASSVHNLELLKKKIPSQYHEKLKLIRSGIVLDNFKLNRGHRGINRKTIIAIGRLVEKKGFTFLIEACNMMKDNGIRFTCQIIGDGPMRETLDQLIERFGLRTRVLLRGALPHERIPAEIQGADIVVAPCICTKDGKEDGLPNSVIEAMAMGLPVVSTEVAGIPEVIRNGETGIVVRTQNSEELADILTRLLEDSYLRYRLGLNAQSLVRQEFDIYKTSLQLLRCFRSRQFCS